MELKVQRFNFSPQSTVGLFSVDGTFECFTLEDKVREVTGQPPASWKLPNITAIPRGRFKVILDRSNRFSTLASAKLGHPIDIIMPHVLDVPGFDGVRIHFGNTSVNTDGCILVGHTYDLGNSDFIGNSQVAYNNLMSKLEACQTDMWLEVQ